MTKQEIIDYMYENHVQGDFKIEEMADDLADTHGEWIQHQSKYGLDGEMVYTCNRCGYNNGFTKTNFCPNCGAKMKGNQNG